MKNLIVYPCFAVIFLISACALPDMETGKQAYKNGDYQTAYNNYSELADFGLPQAKVELGKLYLYGRGPEADPKHALELFRAADAAGNKTAARLIPKAEIKIARENLKSKNPNVRIQGLKLLEQTANSDAEAMYSLAQLYEKGDLLSKDLDKAISLYQQSGDQGYPKGYIRLGHIYEKGLIGPPDQQRAYEYYKLAQDKGGLSEQDLNALHEMMDAYKVADINL